MGLLDSVSSSFRLNTAFSDKLGWSRFDPFKPFLACPPGQPLQRYGNGGDGGKVLCDLSGLSPPCLIYSLGSNGDYSFEQDMLRRTQCHIHTFDCTFFGRSIDPQRHTYHKVCIGRGNPHNFKTWTEITSSLGHTTIDLLKTDIEGHEVNMLGALRDAQSLPQQVVVEMHYHPSGWTGLAPTAVKNEAQMALMFMHMATLGYGVTAREDNHFGEHGCCAEFSFLRVETSTIRST